MDIQDAKNKTKKFMSQNAFSQNKLAKSIGIHQSKISYLINGRCQRYTPIIKRIVDYIDNYNLSSDAKIPICIEQKIKRFLSQHSDMEKPLSEIISNLNTIAITKKGRL